MSSTHSQLSYLTDMMDSAWGRFLLSCKIDWLMTSGGKTDCRCMKNCSMSSRQGFYPVGKNRFTTGGQSRPSYLPKWPQQVDSPDHVNWVENTPVNSNHVNSEAQMHILAYAREGVSRQSTSPTARKWEQREIEGNLHFDTGKGRLDTEMRQTWIAWHATIYLCTPNYTVNIAG